MNRRATARRTQALLRLPAGWRPARTRDALLGGLVLPAILRTFAVAIPGLIMVAVGIMVKLAPCQ